MWLFYVDNFTPSIWITFLDKIYPTQLFEVSWICLFLNYFSRWMKKHVLTVKLCWIKCFDFFLIFFKTRVVREREREREREINWWCSPSHFGERTCTLNFFGEMKFCIFTAFKKIPMVNFIQKKISKFKSQSYPQK